MVSEEDFQGIQGHSKGHGGREGAPRFGGHAWNVSQVISGMGVGRRENSWGP